MDLRSLAKTYLPAPVADALKVAKYNFEIWTYPRRIVWHRYGPYRLQMHIQDRVAQEWYDKDWDLPPEIDFLSRHGLKPGALILDLGAHQCLIAMLLANQVTSRGRVIAVEPNPHNVRVAERNLKVNGVSNVTVTQALISSALGKDRADTGFNSRRNASVIASNLVDTLTIDEMSRRLGYPNVIFMDIEGFEIEALKGGRMTLQGPCTWFIELHGDDMLARYGAANRDVLQFFPADRFTRFVCREGETEFLPMHGEPPHERCFVVFTCKQRPS